MFSGSSELFAPFLGTNSGFPPIRWEIPRFKTIEDIAHELHARYRPRIGIDYDFQALVMGLKNFDTGDSYLRRVYCEGISEEVKDFAIIGHGAPYATTFFIRSIKHYITQ